MEFTREEIEKKAKEMKKEYNRAYAAAHREQRREAERKCWERKALAALEQERAESAK